MRICILARYPPLKGGIATHSEKLVEELAKRGHEVSVITYKKLGRKKRTVKIYEVPITDKFFLRGICYFLGSLIFLIKNMKNVDLIHAHPIHPAGTVASFFKLFSSVPLVITSHGSDLLKWADNPLAAKLFSRVVNSSDKLICVSDFLAKRAEKIGIEKKKITVVYNGVEISSSLRKLGKKELRKELKLPEKRKIILFVGALNEWKRPDILLKYSKEIDGEFIFIGEGPLERKMKDFIMNNKLTNTRMLGPKDHETTLKFIKAADVLVIPSEYEGFGLVALEGMALGTPVVAQPVAALKEILTPKSLSVNLKKKIVEVLENSRLRKEIIKENLRIAKKFSFQKMVDEIEKVYRELYNK